METNSLLSLSPSQLRKAADLKERIESLNSELFRLLTGAADSVFSPGAAKTSPTGSRQMSAAGRARIAAAARARWAKIRAVKGTSSNSAKPAGKRRTMSPAARAKIAAAARARWARAKATGKSRL